MSDQQTLLLQKATFAEAATQDKDIDLSLLKDCAFVETIDLSGPRLIMTMDDRFSVVRNAMQVKVGSVINCILSTAAYDALSPLTFQADFQVMSMPVNGDLVTMNLLQKEIADLKIPSKKAMLFTKLSGQSIESIIKKLAPGFVYDPISGALLNDYHLLPGDRPSMVLRQLAIEHGAMIYAFRGKICFKKMSDLYQQTTNVVFQYKMANADFQIVTYKHLNSDALVSDRVNRKLFGFNLIDGLIQATRNTDYPAEWSHYDNSETMNNVTTIALPVLDIITFGTGSLEPGLPINFAWNMDYSFNDSFSDESLPKSAVIGNVSHYTSGAMNYYCRLKALVPM